MAANRYATPLDRFRLAGLLSERGQLREAGEALEGTPAGDWKPVGGGFIAPQHPCGECRHWRHKAGQETVMQQSMKLDLADIGWDKVTALKELGRCAQQENLLAHRFSTCRSWEVV